MEYSNGYTFIIDIPKFIGQNSEGNLLSLNVGNSFSGSSNSDFRKALLGTIGEGMERQILYDSNVENKLNLNCINLFTKKIESIPVNQHTKKFFFDTCGLATHLSTSNALENALGEFIERQSFIFTYLSKRKVKKVIKNNFFKEIIPDFLHDLKFYEISLISSYKVFFSIGLLNTSIVIGLGAGYTDEEALSKLAKEISSFSPHGSIKAIDGERYDYIHLFHMLPIENIIRAYQFLETSINIYEPKKEKVPKQDEVLDELNRLWGMEPMCTALMNDHYNTSRYTYSKNIKVFDLTWFPSLNLTTFTDEIYDSVETKGNCILDRSANFIPFP